MSKKPGITKSVMDGVGAPADAKVVRRVINPGDETEKKTTLKMVDIDVNAIEPRSINQYRQTKIDRLAKSIRNTNNTLIHPIVVVKASDLDPESDVIKKFEQAGKGIDDLNYIIVSGERRFRAWKKLQAEEATNPNREFYEENPFDKIPARILTKAEAKNEKAFFEDSNLETRQLTPIEAILHIQDALTEVNTPEKKKQALIEMSTAVKGEDNTGIRYWYEGEIPEDPKKAEDKFRTDFYGAYYLSSELGISSVKESTVRDHLAIINKCCDEVINAIVNGEFSEGAARDLKSFSPDVQKELLEIYKTQGRGEYLNALKKYGKGPKQKTEKVRYNYRDTKKQIEGITKGLSKYVAGLQEIVDNTGGVDKQNAQEVLKLTKGYIKQLEEKKAVLKADTKEK